MPSVETGTVTLESQESIARLLLTWTSSAAARKTIPPAVEPGPEPNRIRRGGIRRCVCGECARCRDNARWNEIFDRKFADPAYYGHIAIRHSSPLSGL